MTIAKKGDLVLVLHQTTHTSLLAGPQSRMMVLVGEVTSVSRTGIVKAYRTARNIAAKVGTSDTVHVAGAGMFSPRHTVASIVDGAENYTNDESEARAYLSQFRAAR